VTALYAGAHKNEATPHAPLTPQATDALQTEIDRLYALFVDHVGRMRGLNAEAVRATEAALYFGEDAVAAGLADGVAAFETVLADFAAALARGRSPISTRAVVPPARLALPPLQEMSMTLPTEAAPAQPTPAATPPTAPIAETTAVAAVEAHTEAIAIAELCLLAGCPERTTEFLAARLSAAQVRQVLLQARADQVEIASHHVAGNTSGGMNVANATATNPVLDAVRKRLGVALPQGA
jgi:ClpP class serine protease